MNNLKSLVTKSCEGLSLTSKSEKSYGLKDFLACSTNQMLLTRGGYGSYGGSDGWEGDWPSGTGSYGASLDSSFDSAVGSIWSSIESTASWIGQAATVGTNILIGVVVSTYTGIRTDIPVIPGTGVPNNTIN